MSPEGTAGDLAIVLHSHMPYVEGFGTYPFGEEWLFDAVVRSYLPVLEMARDLTMTVTPVLADQLEDAGAAERLRRFLVEWRIGAAEADLKQVAPECRAACEGERERYQCALELLDAAGGDPLRPVPARRGGGTDRARRVLGDPRGSAAAGDAPGAALADWRRASARTAAASAGTGGSGCPSAPTSPVSSGGWRSRGWAGSASTRVPTTSRWRRSPRSQTVAGPVALPIDWEAISWLWSLDGYPSDPAHAQFAGKSLRGIRIWRSGAAPTTPSRPRPRRERQAGEFLAVAAARLRDYAASHGRRGLLVFAIDTELLGHWWSEGPVWLRGVLEGAEAAGVRLVTVPQALSEHEPVERPLRASTWGEEKDLRTWDSPPVADLATGARRLELRLLRAISGGLRGRRRWSAPRGSCSPPRRATGPFSTSASRRATTPTSAPPITPGGCWRP